MIQNSLTRFSETLQRYSFFLLEKLLCVYKKKERKFRGRSYSKDEVDYFKKGKEERRIKVGRVKNYKRNWKR